MSDTLGVEYVTKGGHGSLDTPFGDSLRAEFYFSNETPTMDESFQREFLGTSKQFVDCHRCAGGGNDPRLLYYVSFRTQANHHVTLIFDFKYSGGALVVFGMLCAAGARKPFRIDVVPATSSQCALVCVFHIGFDDESERRSRQGHVGRVGIHLTVHKIGSVDVDVQVVVINLEQA